MGFDKTVRSDVLLFNNGQIVTSSGWVHNANGTMELDANMSAKIFTYKLAGLPVGKKIVKFKILGAVGADTAQTTVIDADLRRVTGGAGAVTDASVGAITQVSKNADYELDETKYLGHVVAEDYQYYVKVTGTAANNAACDAFITGVEIHLT